MTKSPWSFLGANIYSIYIGLTFDWYGVVINLRFFLTTIFIIWTLLTFIGLWYIVPPDNNNRELINKIWQMHDLHEINQMEEAYHQWLDKQYSVNLQEFSFAKLAALPADNENRLLHEDKFRQWYNRTHTVSLNKIPCLIWSTDDNPARQIQMQLFRRWHMTKYAELIDIVTDPANRETTKMVIQSVVGSGADIIESYGPKQFRAFVDAGIALDITEDAANNAFGYRRCYEASWSSFVYKGRQYGFPANIGYEVLLYNKDIFEQYGIQAPVGGWSIAEMENIAAALTVTSPDIPGGKRWGIVGMHPWPMSLANGGKFFSEDGTVCTYNSRETVEAFQAFHDLLYKSRVMPSPADTASMAAAAGFTGGGNNGLYFAAKLTAMTMGGRWEYVTYAKANRDRVIVPALKRSLADLNMQNDRMLYSQITRIINSLADDVLIPLSESDYTLIRAVLTDDDRSRLLNIGVAHIPTVNGKIKYADVGARVALVNRGSRYKIYAKRFLEFLASEDYNEQINQTYDSICGVIQYCTDEDGISGSPQPLPGLEDFDSAVFIQAMDGAESQQLSPFIGPERQGYLAGQVMDQLMNNRIGPAEAARLIEDRINEQIKANIARDADLKAKWEELIQNTDAQLQPSSPSSYSNDNAASEITETGEGGG